MMVKLVVEGWIVRLDVVDISQLGVGWENVGGFKEKP